MYTDAIIAEMKSFGRFDLMSATSFAAKHKLKVRSVIAKARALEIEYVPQTGKKAVDRRKIDIIQVIEASLGDKFPSLDKMTVPDLQRLEVRLA